jgi:hypothetical protein
MLEIRGGHNEGFLLSGKTYSEGIGKFITSSLSEPTEKKRGKSGQ